MTDDRDATTSGDPVDAWLRAAVAESGRRDLPQLRPLLESLAESTRRLRAAEWNEYVPEDGGRRAGGGR